MVIEDEKLYQFVHSKISDDFGLSITNIAQQVRSHGRFNSWLNGNINSIISLLTAVKENGVSPSFFASYEVTEGYNSSWGWLNHTTPQGNPTEDAISVTNWIKTTSQDMSHNPAWIDFANYNDFVPQSVKDFGNNDFANMASGSIGRVVIAGTAAATWEVYYPNGLLAEYNGVQNYGAPLTKMKDLILQWGGVIGEIDDDPIPPPDPEPDEPEDNPDGIDLNGFIKDLNQLILTMLSHDVYHMGNSNYYTNDFLKLMEQMGNSYKINPNQNFFKAIQDKFKEFNENYIPEPEEPEDPEDPEDPDPPVYTKMFPVKIQNGINFWKRSNWGVGTLQRNMTYGVRSSGANHYGYDIGGGGVRHTIYSVTDGEVIEANYANGIGYKITIKNDNDQYYLQYGHLDSFLVDKGDTVQAGDPIALMGDTGGNYAIHLDIKISTLPNGFYAWETTIDPEQYLEVDRDNSTQLNQP